MIKLGSPTLTSKHSASTIPQAPYNVTLNTVVDATVSRVEPDGIVVKTKSGISKVYFVELPKEVQQRFGYDATKLAEQAGELPKAATGGGPGTPREREER
jgi:hypothetical protein